jgi:GrpB-like predicted nucleotidyltransferase (UPF0157 family)
MRNLEEPWNLTLRMSKVCSRSIKRRVYKNNNRLLPSDCEWSLAYLYSKFAIETFHGKTILRDYYF